MPSRLERLTREELLDLPILSPAHLQEIEEDPLRMETVARLMGAVNLDNLFRVMQRPDTSPSARLEFQKLLNRMGRLEPEKAVEDSSAQGPQVVINITRARDMEDTVTIEGRAARPSPIRDDVEDAESA